MYVANNNVGANSYHGSFLDGHTSSSSATDLSRDASLNNQDASTATDIRQGSNVDITNGSTTNVDHPKKEMLSVTYS